MPCDSDLLQKIYSTSVSERLETAHELYGRFHGLLKADAGLTGALEKLRNLGDQLSAHMTAMNMGAQCVQCASKQGGGCCSLYMSGETDGVQMLMNLLVGIDVKMVRDDGVECCFLAADGCLFLFKPMFCLNYNCSHIKANSRAEMLQELERRSGMLLRQQYLVEQMILDIICDA